MASSILLKKSAVPGKVPTLDSLQYGELAINYADGKLYFKTSDNEIQSFDITPAHNKLLGLLADDHPQYVHVDENRVITATHVLNPPNASPPFVLGNNAQGQLVQGFNSEFFGGYPVNFFYSPQNKPVTTSTYYFTDSLRWVVNHNQNTTNFTETLTDSNGVRFYAKMQIIDANTFQIELTSALSGKVDVTFVH
jgi:hypothetical protein